MQTPVPRHKIKDAPKLPLNMLDALRFYDKDTSLKAAMGEEFSAAYLKLKHAEWNAFCTHFTTWEKENTLRLKLFLKFLATALTPYSRRFILVAAN